MPKKELDQPYCAANGTTATDMTTRSALQSSITAATSATTLARSGNADAAGTLATAGACRTPSMPALHMATTRCPPLLPHQPSPTRPTTAPFPLPLLLAQPAPTSPQPSAPEANEDDDDEEEEEQDIRRPLGSKPAAPTPADLFCT
uniref:Uncharacterized protein n=1 Tax=Oryza brachyantha TaxID=4533 RepID=J3M7R6_ORYBR